MEEYRRLLERADAWYRSVRERFPDRVPCGKGCRDCCLGLFDITPADAELLREGLAQAPADVRADIERRARDLVERLRAEFPRLGEDLDGWSEREIDELCDRLGPVECPALGPAGECRLYAHRPLTCRLSGIPVVDVSGAVLYPEGCARCTLRPEETPPLEAERLRRDERRFLRRRYPGRSGVALLIPQALAPR
ncbi:MAG TPA: YkgJ family cysteine cluster protein [Planctomycetota bacterium]|nr:YkgJ family cysteine cluster protein [Planctomycetota bacterium]